MEGPRISILLKKKNLKRSLFTQSKKKGNLKGSLISLKLKKMEILKVKSSISIITHCSHDHARFELLDFLATNEEEGLVE